jgi:thiamine-monophosphate kinase
LALRGIATAAIDVSDGLLGDLGHILEASGTGARIDTSIAINLLADGADPTRAEGHFSHETRLRCVLAGGDDYELAFTAPVSARAAVQAAALQAQTAVTRIGVIEHPPGLRLVDASGHAVPGRYASFDHFA